MQTVRRQLTAAGQCHVRNGFGGRVRKRLFLILSARIFDSSVERGIPAVQPPRSARTRARRSHARRYCQVNWRRCDQASDAAYCTDAHLRFSLPSSSLPRRNHQSLRVVILSLCPELSRRRGNVSDARRRPHLRNRPRMVPQVWADLCQRLATKISAAWRPLAS